MAYVIEQIYLYPSYLQAIILAQVNVSNENRLNSSSSYTIVILKWKLANDFDAPPLLYFRNPAEWDLYDLESVVANKIQLGTWAHPLSKKWAYCLNLVAGYRNTDKRTILFPVNHLNNNAVIGIVIPFRDLKARIALNICALAPQTLNAEFFAQCLYPFPFQP